MAQQVEVAEINKSDKTVAGNKNCWMCSVAALAGKSLIEMMTDVSIPINFWDYMLDRYVADDKGSKWFLTLARTQGVITIRSATYEEKRTLMPGMGFMDLVGTDTGILHFHRGHAIAVIRGIPVDAQLAATLGRLNREQVQESSYNVVRKYREGGMTFYPTPQTPVELVDIDGVAHLQVDPEQLENTKQTADARSSAYDDNIDFNNPVLTPR